MSAENEEIQDSSKNSNDESSSEVLENKSSDHLTTTSENNTVESVEPTENEEKITETIDSPVSSEVEESKNDEICILKEQNKLLREERDHLLSQNSEIKNERDFLQAKISELESLLRRNEEQWQEKTRIAKKEFDVQTEKLQKERDSMVVKYATSEREVLGLQNYRDTSEKKFRELTKERDLLLEKVKHLNSEKSKISHILDQKCNELFMMQRELEKMKEEINSREIKMRWAQNKLKVECDNHKETVDKVEVLNQQLKAQREENERLKSSLHEAKQKSESSSKMDEAQLLEEKAKIIVEKQNIEEQNILYKNFHKEFEFLKVQHTQIVQENSTNSQKLQTAIREKTEKDQEILRLKEQLNLQREEYLGLQTRVAELEGVQMQLERQRERMESNQQLVEQLKQASSELEEDNQRCRHKEMELLEFTQKLTEKNVQLQSDCTSKELKLRSLEAERESLVSETERLTNELRGVRTSLTEEREQRVKESSVWARNVSEKTRIVEDLQTQLREVQNELASSSRKYAANIKELMRELKATKRRLDQLDSRGRGSGCNSNDVVSLGSRASSSNSINTIGIDANSPEQSPTPPQPHQLPNDWDKTALMEKLVRVQRDSAKMREKIDFLEEHVQHLVNELKKKNRIIQHYFMREETGALASEASDKHKAELAKHSGVMASVYTHKSLDNGLTLELSLEINQKLQAVLEDTLLKNITLKENLNTLGTEIARITQQHQALLQQQKR